MRPYAGLPWRAWLWWGEDLARFFNNLPLLRTPHFSLSHLKGGVQNPWCRVVRKTQHDAVALNLHTLVVLRRTVDVAAGTPAGRKGNNPAAKTGKTAVDDCGHDTSKGELSVISIYVPAYWQ